MTRIPIPRPLRLAAHGLTLALFAAPPVLASDDERRARILAPTTQFEAAERWESLSGGSATNTRRLDGDAFSQPSQNLEFERRAEFFVGNGLFKRLWVSAPASTRSADGLGPLYNARACQRCHLKDGRGHPPASAEDSAVSMVLKVGIPRAGAATAPDPVYGHQLQDLAVPGHAPEGRLRVRYELLPFTYPDGERVELRRPAYSTDELGYGPLADATRLGPRVAQPMIGLGLLEAVSDVDLLALADPDDANGDGISGRVNWVHDPARPGELAVGRFGWKAGQATLDAQMKVASATDMGISNANHPDGWGDCTRAQSACRDAPHGDIPVAGSAADSSEDGFEAGAKVMAAQLFYTRHLAVPARRDVDDAEVLRGKRAFYASGCTGCHVPKLATAREGVDRALRGQLIWPYTDLLLHDMGEGLADGLPEAGASGSEWRTPPLWGIGLTETVNGHTFFLHDGRARNLEEAVLWHGGEAAGSRDAFAALRRDERAALLRFLGSL